MTQFSKKRGVFSDLHIPTSDIITKIITAIRPCYPLTYSTIWILLPTPWFGFPVDLLLLLGFGMLRAGGPGVERRKIVRVQRRAKRPCYVLSEARRKMRAKALREFRKEWIRDVRGIANSAYSAVYMILALLGSLYMAIRPNTRRETIVRSVSAASRSVFQ